ncbi:MAG: hypothetical protein EBV03_02190 [Proteobacteria bacterium]|nr:hypothetical protein [Pseudomonadota bacterium]
MTGTPRDFNAWDALKLLAIAFMFVDHASAFFLTADAQVYWLRAIGRGAAPIFMFLAGFSASYRFSRELLVLAVVLSAFDWLYFWHINTLNILFTILISRAIFQWFESRGRLLPRPWEWFVGSVALFVSSALVEYGSMGFMLAYAGYLRRHMMAYGALRVWRLTGVIFATYAAYEIAFPTPPISPLLGAAVMGGVYWLLMTFEPLRPVLPGAPAGLKRLLTLLARYSGYVYVGHLIVLMALSGHPM